MPYGLGGKDVLYKASCKPCAKITGALEGRLLRGHWWPYRTVLKLQSRSPSYPKYESVNLKVPWRESIPANVRKDEVPLVVILEFDPPSVLEGIVRIEAPYAPRMCVKFIAPMPTRVLVEGRMRQVESYEQIEFPTNFSAADLARFLAKVAHCHAIYVRGFSACSEYFLPPYILGNGDGALTYVGGDRASILGPLMPGSGLHAMLDRRQGEYLAVNVQLFRDCGDPTPIYDVVVGRLTAS